MSQGLGVQLGLGGGRSSTSSGSPVGGGAVVPGFNIAADDRRLEANIITAAGTTAGDIAFGTDTHNLYVWDGLYWNIYNNT
jgi:hypothetical protein